MSPSSTSQCGGGGGGEGIWAGHGGFCCIFQHGGWELTAGAYPPPPPLALGCRTARKNIHFVSGKAAHEALLEVRRHACGGGGVGGSAEACARHAAPLIVPVEPTAGAYVSNRSLAPANPPLSVPPLTQLVLCCTQALGPEILPVEYGGTAAEVPVEVAAKKVDAWRQQHLQQQQQGQTAVAAVVAVEQPAAADMQLQQHVESLARHTGSLRLSESTSELAAVA